MAGRPRCVNCRKAFTPNFRNRTKVNSRQRVCAECGPVIGHRFADQRYRASDAAPVAQRRKTEIAVRQGATAVPDVGPVAGSGSGSPVETLENRIRLHAAAIAAVLETPEAPDGCEASRPLPIRNAAESSPVGALMAAGPESSSR